MAALAATLLALGGGVPGSSHGCSGGSPWQSQCSVTNTGTQVDVGGSTVAPGGGGGDRAPGGTNGGTNGNGNNGSTEQTDTIATDPGAAEECPPIGCRGNYTVVVIPDVTLQDLASFVPPPPALGGEPAGFGITGMPTNLVATASTQYLTGQVLGWDVTVRFVPAFYEFDYGDGTATRTNTGGASWAALGLPQFSPTSTSHVYRERGTYTVALTLNYSAAVDFGTGGWRPVPGFVRSPANPYALEVLDARTALVDRTCIESPSGPGC